MNKSKTKAQAEVKARRFEKLLNTNGITDVEIDVWENIDWHYCARHPLFNIHEEFENGKLRYWAMIGRNGSGFGYWTSAHQEFKTPKQALVHALTAAQKFTESCAEHVKGVLACIKP